MSAKFEKAVTIVQALPANGPNLPSQEKKLSFYGLYKQATMGDVNTPRPGILAFVDKAKWDAWNKVKGKSAEDAKKEYVNTLLEVLKEADTEESKKYIAEIEAA